jgi:hypothetical protein
MSTPEFAPQAAVEQFTRTWQRVMTDARGFFADMPQAGGLREPLVFLTVCAVLDGAGHLVTRWSVLGFVSTVVGEVAWTFVLAAILVMLAQHVFGGHTGFEPTFRALAYAAAPTVLAWIPRLGILFVLWSWYLAVRGVERVQEFDPVRAVLTVAIGVSVLLLAGRAVLGVPLLPS